MKKKTDLTKVPTNALWKELQRRESNEYARRVHREIKLIRSKNRLPTS